MRMAEACIKEVLEEPAALEAESVENRFPQIPCRDKAKESEDLSEEDTDLSTDDNTGAEDQQLKTAYTI